MFELPEAAVIAGQLAREVAGRTVVRCVRGDSPHRFVFYNLGPEEYAARAAGKTAGRATARAKCLTLPLEPGYLQLFGEMGGRLLLHGPGAPLPARHHLLLQFDDGRTLTAMTQMWGMIGLMTPAEAAADRHFGTAG